MGLVIDMKNVSWMREKKKILNEVTWQVKKGEHWAILGLNGSGKSSLLNLINGYIWPSSGELTVLGERFGQTQMQRLRTRIGWVSTALQSRFHGYEYAETVVVSGKFATIGVFAPPSPTDMEEAVERMEQMGIGHLYHREFSSCSQGEQQRLLIARAMMSGPRLLILDEPTNGLDLFARENFLTTIEILTKQDDGPTLLYVTHHPEEILPTLTKTLLLRAGEVFLAGNTNQLLTEETLSRFFSQPIKLSRQNERIWILPVV